MDLRQQCIQVGGDGLNLIHHLIGLLDPQVRAAFLEARLSAQTLGQVLGFIAQTAGEIAPELKPPAPSLPDEKRNDRVKVELWLPWESP